MAANGYDFGVEFQGNFHSCNLVAEHSDFCLVFFTLINVYLHPAVFIFPLSTERFRRFSHLVSLSLGKRQGSQSGHHRTTQSQMRHTNVHARTHSLGQFGVTNLPNMHVFGWWEEAGVPGKNPCIHGENMQIFQA